MLTKYEQKNLVWVDLVAPTPAEVRGLMQEFDLDPRIAEELLSRSFKPKVERFTDMLYVILHFPTLRGLTPRPQQEIDFVIGRNFLITTRYETIDPLHSFAKAFEVNAVLGRNQASHGGHLFVSIAQSLYNGMADECEVVQARLEDIEERVFAGNEKKMVAELSLTGKVIHDFRQALLPHREMLNSFEAPASRLFGGDFSYYIRNLYGAYERVGHIIANLREELTELRQTNDSLLSTKQNEIMKTLTIMAFVTFPLTLVSSILGMNTKYLPFVGLPGDFWFVMGIMSLMAGSFFFYFKHKGWL